MILHDLNISQMKKVHVFFKKDIKWQVCEIAKLIATMI